MASSSSKVETESASFFEGSGCERVCVPSRRGSSRTISDGVLSRFSCRAFLGSKMPKEDDVRDIVAKACRAASGGNLQPWHVFVLAGRERRRLVEAVRVKVAKGEVEMPQYPMYPDSLGGELDDVYKQRRRKLGYAMYSLMGIKRKEKEKRAAAMARNWEFFDAPVGIIIAIDRQMNAPQYADLGIFIQNIGVLARERGLHTCYQESWSVYPETVASTLGISDKFIVFCGIAMGYADWTDPVNNLVSTRAPLDQVVHFCGLDGCDDAATIKAKL